MRICIFFFLLVFCRGFVYSQLKPAIGQIVLPPDNALICHEPFYLGNFYTTGFHHGDTVPDFKLYGLQGDSLVLSQALASGKPALLIAGSLTCPVFRAKVATINQVVSTYSSNIHIYVIYTLEAHPTDTSVYFGYVNVTSQNTSAGILFPQPQTYGQRKNLVDTMSSYVSLNAPVFIDGPCNNWWKNFGPAPNNSYLIGTNGVVLNKHGWFHKSPDHIFCDLDSILNLNKGLCVSPPSAPGNFNLDVLNSSVTGMPGDVLYDYVDIVNTSSVITSIKIKKLQKTHPVGWQTAICADVCYTSSDDSVEVNIDPFDTLHFSLDFFTDLLPDTGSVRVGFKNTRKSTNAFSIWLKANTFLNPVGFTDHNTQDHAVQIYPNPATDHITVIGGESYRSLSVYDATGREVVVSINERKIDTSQWPDGIYLFVLRASEGSLARKVLIAN